MLRTGLASCILPKLFRLNLLFESYVSLPPSFLSSHKKSQVKELNRQDKTNCNKGGEGKEGGGGSCLANFFFLLLLDNMFSTSILYAAIILVLVIEGGGRGR